MALAACLAYVTEGSDVDTKQAGQETIQVLAVSADYASTDILSHFRVAGGHNGILERPIL